MHLELMSAWRPLEIYVIVSEWADQTRQSRIVRPEVVLGLRGLCRRSGANHVLPSLGEGRTAS